MQVANDSSLLEAVPNIAADSDAEAIDRIARAFAGPGRKLLDIHRDADHQRSVLTAVGEPQALAEALLGVARYAISAIDMHEYHGVHPCIGALDVLPIVYLRQSDRELAHDEALGVGNRIAAELDLPVFLYGELASDDDRRERAFFRDGGVAALASRLEHGELTPDFGPRHLHPTAGGVLVTARPPLVAFNLELAGASVEQAKQIAAKVRESGGGLPGVRAIGLQLEQQGVVQVSTNVHDPLQVPLRVVVDAVTEHAQPFGASVSGAELVGLAPAGALEGLPDGLLRNFDPRAHVLENRIEGNGQL